MKYLKWLENKEIKDKNKKLEYFLSLKEEHYTEILGKIFIIGKKWYCDIRRKEPLKANTLEDAKKEYIERYKEYYLTQIECYNYDISVCNNKIDIILNTEMEENK